MSVCKTVEHSTYPGENPYDFELNFASLDVVFNSAPECTFFCLKKNSLFSH